MANRFTTGEYWDSYFEYEVTFKTIEEVRFFLEHHVIDCSIHNFFIKDAKTGVIVRDNDDEESCSAYLDTIEEQENTKMPVNPFHHNIIKQSEEDRVSVEREETIEEIMLDIADNMGLNDISDPDVKKKKKMVNPLLAFYKGSKLEQIIKQVISWTLYQ